jgi:plastocyanin
MKSKRIPLLVVLIAAAVSAFVVPRSARGVTAVPDAAVNPVAIVATGGSCTSEFCYSPADLTIRQGTSVTWTNDTTTIHTVSSCTAAACSGVGPGTGTDPAFDSPIISPGGTFTVLFHGTGTYNYYCQIHGYTVMHGTITVKPFIVKTTKLVTATKGKPYSEKLAAAGGETPLHWTITKGALPTGLKLSGTGVISGTPTTSGAKTFTVKVTDSSTPPLTAKRAFTLTVT